MPTTAVCSISGAFWESSYLIRTALPRPVQLTKQARPLPSTYHISFVLWYHSNLARKEHVSSVLSSAKQRACLQSPVYLSLPSAAQLVTLVIATVTEDRSSKIISFLFVFVCYCLLAIRTKLYTIHIKFTILWANEMSFKAWPGLILLFISNQNQIIYNTYKIHSSMSQWDVV